VRPDKIEIPSGAIIRETIEIRLSEERRIRRAVPGFNHFKRPRNHFSTHKERRLLFLQKALDDNPSERSGA
jgi:hypothetical protein